MEETKEKRIWEKLALPLLSCCRAFETVVDESVKGDSDVLLSPPSFPLLNSFRWGSEGRDNKRGPA